MVAVVMAVVMAVVIMVDMTRTTGGSLAARHQVQHAQSAGQATPQARASVSNAGLRWFQQSARPVQRKFHLVQSFVRNVESRRR
tara:strand:- start:273 stop:524 length:252 start_codon:yes stop_codon:yes gene_type:complete